MLCRVYMLCYETVTSLYLLTGAANDLFGDSQ